MGRQSGRGTRTCRASRAWVANGCGVAARLLCRVRSAMAHRAPVLLALPARNVANTEGIRVRPPVQLVPRTSQQGRDHV
eukprot:2460131-Alexandrium_andersonii.AAC.1